MKKENKKSDFITKLEEVYGIPDDKVENRTNLFDKSSVFENHPNTNERRPPTLSEIKKALRK